MKATATRERARSSWVGAWLMAGCMWALPSSAAATESVEPAHVVELQMAATTTAAYQDSMRWVRSGDAIQLLTSMRSLAQRDPHPLVIGRLVRGCAMVAEGPDAHDRVETLLKDADDHPSDPLRQLIAGVAVHYRGHHTGTSVTHKLEDYRRALHYLKETRGHFHHAARYWLYTAVSHFRLGHQQEAEEAIAMAVKTDIGSDADVFYSQAEIAHLKDPGRAITMLRRYQSLMHDNHARGGFSAPEKEARVGEMISRLDQARRGRAIAEQERLFDPIKERQPIPMWLAVTLAIVLGAGIGWVGARRRSR